MHAVRIEIPDWLKVRDGELRVLPDGKSLAVVLEGKPLYVLKSIPADAKHACEVMQTNNGKHITNDIVCTSSELALCSGLEALRQALGW